ncbi:ATP-dependent helicase [Bradyrhizobium sp. G127]|uniref:ATP-dependent helicase n=1 Tax=Bradyrhizobium sp. G127 TaxID=2904800 RepID=UPI001F36669B|nr:ATP-dependent helicase [Bradyrhizobium sp. G127]MCF2523216.1 UvrD-helicase domain-containing protein [Bradyrhizobium sp. G127]
MDAFEPVRDAATRLHFALVSKDAPCKPMELAQAAVAHLKLELAWLPTGDPALKGARAVFDEQSGTIFAEDTGEPGARALVIAHEIGHVCIHTGSSKCTAHDVDPTRSTESAPVGLQRVEDYGAHERRELQANVFAREFLFPRALARKMFVTEALSASAIAKQLDLPIPLVRQQILDEVLLPAPAESPEDVAHARAPQDDKAQDRAAAHRGAPFQLQAGPGTGKTKTLVKRILSLLAEGIDPSSILVLTFSNRAAGELAERVAAVAPDKAPQIWIGTFHAFGLDLVRRHYDQLDLPADPALFDRSDAIAVLEEILPTLPLVHYRNLWDPALVLKEVLSAISRAKDELVGVEDYRKLAKAMLAAAAGDDDIEAAQKCLEVADIYERYEQAKRDHAAVDFGDLIMRPTLLLESNPALRTAIQLRHRHVLVDEYQDVNRASVRLVKALAGDGKRLWVVGDARQSIYRFRGASSINMAAFKSEYPTAAIDQLEISYRSIQQIIDAFSALAPHMGASEGMLSLRLTADRGAGPEIPDLRRFQNDDDEEEGIAAGVRELEAKGVPLRNQAVLCRTNRRLNEIAAALEIRGIPVLHLGSLFERDEVRDLLALLSLAVDPFGDALIRVASLPRYHVPLQDIHAAIRHYREERGLVLERLDELPRIAGLSKDAVDGFTRLAQDLKGLRSNSHAWEFLTSYLLDRTDTGRQMASAASVSARMRNVAVWQFLNFLREQSPVSFGLPIQRTLDRVRQLVLLAEERDLRQVPTAALHMDAVRLMTVHGSKGLEFEAVHLPGMTQASFPSSYRGQRCPPPVGLISGAGRLSVSDEAKRSHAQEEECLFFVAVSRARTYLRFYQPCFQPNGNKRSPSVLLAKIPRHLIHETATPPKIPLPPDAPRPTPIKITYAADWAITDRRLELYQKCPRRFFYTHVLGLGSARKMTAFSRTHDCIYEVIRWLAETRIGAEPTLAEAEATFENVWQTRGPKDHAFAPDYRRLASRLVGALVSSGAGRRFRKSEPLAIDFTNGRVVVEPNEMAELPDGTVILRRIRTGYRTQQEYDGLEYTLYQLAGAAHYGRAFQVEALHLTDETMEAVSITATKLNNRRDETDEMLGGINAGAFPPKIDPVTCPRCPHFFICPAAPRGPLAIS